ncbi:hypothetical protein ACVW1A_004481 [Bradyrhizobium sp. LB1.3]
MSDGPFDVFALIIAIIAFIIAIKASSQAAGLRRRLSSLEEMFCAQRQVQPPPLMPAPPMRAEAPAATSEAPPPLAPDADAPPPRVTQDVSPPPLEASTDAPPPLPAPAPGFEERLGTRWVVWIGGLALALGGFFMVRYSIEAGLVGPGVRVFLGGVFALALLGAGEWSRRKESISNIAALPIANIPAILTAAGTAVAFATIYAAYALYGFLVPATAFVLLGLVALGTLAAALLHGPALAGLGVVGAFVTPILVSSGKPDYWALYIYLAIVTAASFGLARIRLWRWLAVTTIAFAVLWIFPGLDTSDLQVAPHAFHVIAGFVLAALLVVCGFMFGPTIEDGEIEPVSSNSLGAYLFGAMLIVLSSAHADLALIAFTLLVGATLLVAWRAPAATGALGAAAATVFIVFAEWAVRANPDMLVLPGGPLAGIAPTATDSAVTLHLVMAAVFAAGFGIAGFLAQGRSNSAIIPVVWSAAAVATPIAILVALYARIAHLDRSIPFAILAVLLAAAFGAATETLARRETRPGGKISTALFATGTLGALALALTFALEKGWLTIALALMSLGTAWISMQRPIPFLRWLAAIFAGLVTARIGYDPRIVGDAVGTTPIFNWLVVGLRLAGGIVLGSEPVPAPPRRRRPAAHGRERRDPVHRAARLHGDPPFCDRRQHDERTVAARMRAAGLRCAGHGDRAGALATAQPQYRAQCRRGRAHGDRRARQRVWPVDPGEPDAVAHRCRRRRVQPAAARLRAAGGADAAALLCRGRPTRQDLRQHDRGRRAAVRAHLCHAGDPPLLSRPDPLHRGDDGRRAIHLFDRLARLRRGAAWRRHSRQFGAGAAGLGRRNRADDPEGLRHRHVDADGRLPRVVIHVPRHRAGRDRLALPAHPVPAAGRTAAGSADKHLRIRPRGPIPGTARPRP